MPVIAPALLKKWQHFKKTSRVEVEGRLYDDYRDHKGYQEMPSRGVNVRHFLCTLRAEPSLDWKVARGSGVIEEAQWEDFGLYFTAKQVVDDEQDSSMGRFTDKCPAECRLSRTWRGLHLVPGNEYGWKVGPSSPSQHTHRNLKGPDSRHLWRAGVHDRTDGKGKNHREYRYIVLENYDYDEFREMYWLQGFSKHEADLLARRQFKALVEYMERWGRGDEYNVGVVVTCYADEERTEEIGAQSVWGIESSAGDYFDEVARDLAHQAKAEALDNLREKAKKVNDLLTKVETRLSK
jgi:hypothetical protein